MRIFRTAAVAALLLAVFASIAGAVEPAGAEHRINSKNPDNTMQPASAGFDKGGYVVVWAAPDSGIHAQIYNATGDPRGKEFRVAKGADLTDPKVATLSNGWFTVAWQSYDSSKDRYTVRGKVFTGSGNQKGDAFTPKKKKWGSQRPSLAAIGKKFIVVWRAVDGNIGKGIFGQRHGVRGQTLGKPFLITNNTNYATIARIDSDKYFVAWEDFSDAIKGRRLRKNGDKIGKPIKVSPSSDLERRHPVVAALPNLRRFIVFWRTETNVVFVNTIDARVYNRRARPLRKFVVASSYNAATTRMPAAATLHDGRVVVAWSDDASFFDPIVFQMITGGGKPDGDTVEANLDYQGQAPAVAPASPDSFIVAWQGAGSTPDNIYGRLFDDD